MRVRLLFPEPDLIRNVEKGTDGEPDIVTAVGPDIQGQQTILRAGFGAMAGKNDDKGLAAHVLPDIHSIKTLVGPSPNGFAGGPKFGEGGIVGQRTSSSRQHGGLV